MKLRKLFMTLLLALGVGAGAAAGVSATVLNETKEPQVADAAGNEKTVYFQNNWKWTNVKYYYWGVAGSPNWPGNNATKLDGVLLDQNPDGYEYYKVTIPANVTGLIFNGTKNDGSGNTDQTPDIKTDINDGNCYYMHWSSGNQVKTFTLYQVKILDIDNSQTELNNGSKTYYTSDKTNKIFGNPTDRNGYFYNGLYTDKACTTLLKQDLSNAINTFYRQYVPLGDIEYDYVYLNNIDEKIYKSGNIHLYIYNSETDGKLYGEWPGNKTINFSELEVKKITFNGEKLYKLELPMNYFTHFILNVDGSQSIKTRDLIINKHHYFNLDTLKCDDNTGEPAGNENLGIQAHLATSIVEGVESLTESYTYENNTYSNSICSFDANKIQNILNEYKKLGDTSVFDSTVFETNKVDERAEAKYTGTEIIKALNIRYKQLTGASILQNANLLNIAKSNENNALLIVVIVSFSTICAFAILIKFRKKEEK